MSSVENKSNRRKLLQNALVRLESLQSKLDAMERMQKDPIAIVGIGCRFPGAADDPEAFWRLLSQGVDTVTEVPAERWDVDAFYDPDPDAPGKSYTRWGAFLSDVDKFDPQFFGISPREAVSMDPQQRLLLEVTWEALEQAGYAPDSLTGSQTGVFIGITSNDYSHLQIKAWDDLSGTDAYFSSGVAHSVASGRLSYTLGLEGQSLTIDTACSSSSVATHQAVQTLRSGECDMALAGGVNLILSPDGAITTSRSRMMAFDGRCKTFDESADGYVRGEGCAMVVMKRLSDALEDRDNVLAVILGSALNQDGRSNGLTAPNGRAQEAVIRAALKNADVSPGELSYLEAHGTGTTLGDPIELRALDAVYGTEHSKENPLLVGSVKTNVGHLEAAAGIVGLIKVVLALQHKTIPPHLHFNQPNPLFPWDDTPVIVPTAPVPWEVAGNSRRLAGLSSFGFSGTNSHMIIAEAPVIEPEPVGDDRPYQILTISGKGDAALEDLAKRFAEYLNDSPTASLADICYTTNVGRTHFHHRLALTAQSSDQLNRSLTAWLEGQEATSLLHSIVPTGDPPEVVFLFTGQGSQYVGMGRELYDTQPLFRQVMDECDELLRPYLERPLLSVIFADEDTTTALIDETAYTQPALFAIEYALAQLWRSWGIEPDVVLGHSVGEYVAACIAGVFSLEDGLKLIAARGRLMQDLPRDGAMAAVFAGIEDVQRAIEAYPEQLSIAAINGPNNVVISGVASAVESALETLDAAGIKARRLTVSHAFHSPLMDPILDTFEETAASVRYKSPQIGLISNVTGKLAGPEISDAVYWRQHIRATVRFADSMKRLQEQGYLCFLEIGPKPTLIGMGRRCFGDQQAAWLPSLRPQRDDWHQLSESLAGLHVQGVDIDWTRFHQDHARKHVVIPVYPFQRQRYWVDLPSDSARTRQRDQVDHPLLDQPLRSPLIKETIFESVISPDYPAYIYDHRIHGTPLFPGTGYLELALAAAKEIYGPQAVVLDNVFIQDVMVLPESGERTVQIVVTPAEEDVGRFQVFSQEPEHEDTWKLHASGNIRIVLEADEPQGDTLPEPQLPQLPDEEMPVADYYQRLSDVGVTYGPAFRGLAGIWQREGDAVGKMALPEFVSHDADRYQLHPALLDACFQLIGAAVPAADDDQFQEYVYVPVNLDSYRVFQPGHDSVWCEVSLQLEPGTSIEEQFSADLRLFDESGRTVAEIKKLHMKRIERKAIKWAAQQRHDDWLYEIKWELKPPQEVESVWVEGTWLIFADRDGVGESLAARLQEQGASSIVVRPGAAYYAPEKGQSQINPARPEEFRQLINDVFINHQRPYRGAIHMWSLDASPETTVASLEADQELNLGSILHLVQALAEKEGEAELENAAMWLVTRGVQFNDIDHYDPSTVAQAPVLGLANTISLEHTSLNCVCLDLDLAAEDPVLAIVSELSTEDGENRISWRDNERYVARLAHVEEPDRGLVLPESESYVLDISERGILDNLYLRPKTHAQPGPGEVEVRVKASGLNFRDVLNAMGMYPGPAGPLGNECAGTVISIGEGVTSVAPGDEVMVLAESTFSDLVITRAQTVYPKLPSHSFADATTIPLAYLTAFHGLFTLAQIKAGDRVLIHAAAGGVGMAAVQLARMAGAEVFGTAGSPRKRAFLKSNGVQHVMNSRTLDFADEITTITSGEGVDIVLNALADEFIPKSLSVLADGGCFLEIGKRGIWTADQVAALNPTLRYFPYDLADVMRDEPDFMQVTLQQMLPDFESGALRPLPLRSFPMSDVIDAFRYMARAKHIGKVVVLQEDDSSTRESGEVLSDATYLISGGLGGLGLVMASGLVERGARHLVLMGRSGASEDARRAVDELEQVGATVWIAEGDVSATEDVDRILTHVAETMPPLRGVIHAAGVIDDGVLIAQSWSRFEGVMAPKMAGAWNLHMLTQDIPLDFFAMFSAGAALIGSPGQGNYAAANAFLDGLAHYRRGEGLPALSINWGAWKRVGMAASLDSRERRRWASSGIEMIEPEVGFQIFDQLLSLNHSQVGVLPMNWSIQAQQISVGKEPPLLRQLIQSARSKSPAKEKPAISKILSRLKPAGSDERYQLLLEYVESQVIGVLGLDSSQPVDHQLGLTDIGMDSLMAVELSNRLERSLEQKMPSTLAFEHPTVAALADYLMTEIVTAPADSDEPHEWEVDELQERARRSPQPVQLVSELDDDLPTLVSSPSDAIKAVGNQIPAIQPISREGPMPLSFSQQRLLFVDEFDPGLAVYNIATTVRMQGLLNGDVLERCLLEILRRHESLRTNFALEDGTPTQLIEPIGGFSLPVINLEATAEDLQEAEIRRLADEEARRPFDLSRDLKLRVILLRLGRRDHVLLLTMHHIAFDGWSQGIFFYELAALYEAFVSGEPSPLPELPVQYADFAHWQRLWLQGELFETQLAYWKRQLGSNPPALNLQTDRPRPATQTFNGDRCDIVIPAELSASLKKLSRQEGVTPYMLLLASLETLLFRYTGQEDFVIGSPIAGRNQPDIKELIGFFINILPMRADLSGNPTFRQLLQRVQSVALEAYRHQDFPFDRLVEEIQTERNLSHSPVFQVMFILHNAPIGAPDLPDLKLSMMDVHSGTAKFDLDFSLIDLDGEMSGWLEYNSDLFDQQTIKHMLEHWQMIMKAIVTDPEQSLIDLSLLTARDREQLLVEWNETESDYPHDQPLHHLFELQVARVPDKTAVVFKDQSLTYHELNKRANQVARYLRSLGVKDGSLVGVYMERSLEMVVGLLGILKAGGAYVPLDPAFPAERLNYMLVDSGARVMMTQQDLPDLGDQLDIQPVFLDSDWAVISQESSENLHSQAQPENLAYVIYTSGSTGKPKGVQIRHKGVVNFLASMQQEPGLTADDMLLSVTTLSFDISVLEIFLPLITGAQLLLVSHETAIDGQELMATLADSGATVMQATPATWRILLEVGWQGNGDLKILCGGEAFPPDLAKQLLERCGSLWNMYGPTETTVWSAVYRVRQTDGLLPIGRPIANTSLYILDSHYQPVPTGVPGELYIGGDGLAAGYLNRPELTAEKFVPHIFDDTPGARLYRTGDLARYLPDGNVEFIGRIDHQVKIRGFRIELGEIETVLAQHPAIREVVVIVREDRPGDKRLAAYIIPEDEQISRSTSSENEFRSFVRKHLPEYMVPSHYTILNKLPLTPNGKINRRALPKPDQTRREGESDFVPPRNAVEERLAEMWVELLALESVGVYDDFFDLGGHSLLVPKLSSEIFKVFEIELSLKSLFATPILADLALLIVQKKAQRVDRDIIVHLLSELSEIEVYKVNGKGEAYEDDEIFDVAKQIAELPPEKLNILIQRLSLVDEQTIATESEQTSPDSEDNVILLPRTRTEMLLAIIWIDILEIEQVGINDDFFELGGTSLQVSQLNDQLQENFGVKIPLHQLFQVLTISELAEVVGKAKASQSMDSDDHKEIDSLVDYL